ncbi:hypothetical protein DFR67_10597 [Williamsia limnetica]|uniref:Uncharacterized protein n=1 Tax=Williamsia limnetica TaxID=882452 RepID=A0A318RNI5_WILLI|nr:hypothetical protein DFR67_10597 [Williamsia limnetica]
MEQYLAALAMAGGPALKSEDAWKMYRALLFTAYEAAVVTATFGSRLRSAQAALGVGRAVEAVQPARDRMIDQISEVGDTISECSYLLIGEVQSESGGGRIDDFARHVIGVPRQAA